MSTKPQLQIKTVRWDPEDGSGPRSSTFQSVGDALSPVGSGVGTFAAQLTSELESDGPFDGNLAAFVEGESSSGDSGDSDESEIFMDEYSSECDSAEGSSGGVLEVDVDLGSEGSGSGELLEADAALTPGSLAADQREKVEHLTSILGLSEMVARALLSHYLFDLGRLMEAYVENPQQCLEQVGGAGAGALAGVGPGQEASTAPLDMCFICAAEEVPVGEYTRLACGDAFCNVCWSSYFAVKIRDGEVAGMRCMGEDCTQFVDEAMVRRLVDDETFTKYQRFMLQDYVSANSSVVWCPAPGCENAVRFDDAHEAVCACGFRFCALCSKESHVPASCKSMRDWEKKMQSDGETIGWILQSTKDCPKCGKPIEKNGGCNHMTCRPPGGCRHEFCWLCLGDWRNHYNCQPKTQEELAQLNRSSLSRYLHYHTRFKEHMASRSFEEVLRSAAQHQIARFRAENPDKPYYRLQCILDGVEALIYCRQAAAYAYVHAFFLESGSVERNLFEYLQAELENKTEALSEELEKPVEQLDRAHLRDLTKNALRRLRHLLDGAAEGLTADADARVFDPSQVAQMSDEDADDPGAGVGIALSARERRTLEFANMTKAEKKEWKAREKARKKRARQRKKEQKRLEKLRKKQAKQADTVVELVPLE